LPEKIQKNKNVYRLIDANANRAKEGLRVLEDIVRFIADEKKLTADFKGIRHLLTRCLAANAAIRPLSIIKQRQVRRDVGKATTVSEAKRKNVTEVFLANAQRVKESLRVLEEFFKLYDKKISVRLKAARYKMYALEKRSIEKIAQICNNNS